MSRSIITSLILFLLLSTQSYARTISVKENGTGDYTTIQSAVNAANTGDIIDVYSGTYYENVSITGKTGTEGNKYTLQVHPGESATITYGGDDETLYVGDDCDWWIIDGFTIQHTGDFDYMVRSYSNADVTIKNCTVTRSSFNTNDHGIVIKYCLRGYVYNNTVTKQQTFAINTSGSSYCEVHDNEIYNCGIGVCPTRNNDTKIYNNYIHDLAGEFYRHVYLRDNQRAKVYNNVFEGGTVGVYVYEYTGPGDNEVSEDGEIYNNTIVGVNRGVYFYGGTSNGYVFKNNIFYNCDTYAIDFYSRGGTSSYGNNDFYDCTVHGGGANSGYNITSNPVFRASGDKPSPYYDLQSSSPCKDAGVDNDSDIPDFDYNGSARYGSQWIGAFEYTSDGPPPTTTTSTSYTNQPPNASFNYNPTSEILTVNFTDTSSDNDGIIVSRYWDFGDGTTSTQQNPSHTYSTTGIYTVTLTVTDNDTATDNASITIDKKPPSPPTGVTLE